MRGVLRPGAGGVPTYRRPAGRVFLVDSGAGEGVEDDADPAHQVPGASPGWQRLSYYIPPHHHRPPAPKCAGKFQILSERKMFFERNRQQMRDIFQENASFPVILEATMKDAQLLGSDLV